MDIISLDIPDVKILKPVRHNDQRGFFSEIFSQSTLKAAGLQLDIAQENFAFSIQKNTIRGLHYQAPPYAQDKLIQVVRGAIYDVALDLRNGSPWFGQFVGAEISADNWNQILVPAGFAHGLCTLEPNTAVIYKVTAPYSPDHEEGIRWNDPDLQIPWPISPQDALLSDRDQSLPHLSELDSPFDYAKVTP
jgi:dTDP-4-dehydrorhamnose 3,5-epimerase